MGRITTKLIITGRKTGRRKPSTSNSVYAWDIQQAEAAKRPVVEILALLGVTVSPSNLLGDNEINPSKQASQINPGNDISPSKTRRHKGEGSGSIHWRTITKNGRDYPQAYYHYEFWSEGDRAFKSSKYIPKRLLKRVQQMEQEKMPVSEILQVLGVMK